MISREEASLHQHKQEEETSADLTVPLFGQEPVPTSETMKHQEKINSAPVDQIPGKKSFVVNLSSAALTSSQPPGPGLSFVPAPSVSPFEVVVGAQKCLGDRERKEFLMKTERITFLYTPE